jgi:MFS family permease
MLVGVTDTTLSRPGFLHSKVGGLPRAFWVLWAGTLVNRLGTMVEPFVGVYLIQARGVSLAGAGMVMAVYGGGTLLSQLIAGWLADRVGRRLTLTGGTMATAALMLLLGYSASTPVLVALMFALGLVMDAYRPASQALVADLIDPADRPRAYGLLFWAVNLGFSAAMIAGGWLASSGFTWLFWIDAATSVVFGLLVWRAVPETGSARRQASGGFRDVLRDRVMVAFVGIMLCYTSVYLQAFSTLPLAMIGRGLPTGAYGAAMAVNGVLIVIIQPLAGSWIARRDPTVMLALGMGIASAGFALTALASSTPGYAASVVVWTLGEIVTAGVSGTVVASLAPPHLRGRYAGLYGFAWSAGALVAPLFGTRLLAIGPSALWLSAGALGMLAALGQLALGPAIRRRATS